MKSERAWAIESFGHAELGDERRTRRLVGMARRAARSPAGRVTEVFCQPAERQAAYDFLEHEAVSADAVSEALFGATAKLSRRQDRVFVVLDGTSLSLSDRDGAKEFGSLGPGYKNGKGLKVLNALALTQEGAAVGVADQIWWCRPDFVPGKRRYQAVTARESIHWRNAVDRIAARYAKDAPRTKLHFLADREFDASLLLKHLVRAGHEFTIRSNATRKAILRSRPCKLRPILGRQPVLARMSVDLSASAKRDARRVTLDIRAVRLPLRLRDRVTKDGPVMRLTVVWAVERGRMAASERVDWMLITNTEVTTAHEACAVVRRYAYRWRIEDFHKTWKSGHCRVEDTQLRSPRAVIKWATILAAVAGRVERLRYRYRHEPEVLATEEFTVGEIEAVVFLKNEDRREKLIAHRDLSLQEVVRWIADLGGYVGGRRNPHPGATTISRGLEKVLFAAELFRKLREQGLLR